MEHIARRLADHTSSHHTFWPQRFRAAICTLAASALLIAPLGAHAQVSNMMPLPAHAIAGTGQLKLDAGLQVAFEGAHDARLDRARDRFLRQLSLRTGIYYLPTATQSKPVLRIHTDALGKPVQEVGEDESYHLEVTPDSIDLHAPTSLGTLHGLQTLLQLIHSTPNGFVIDATRIDDAPRFPWRGLMIDTGRHFQPVDVIKQNLDLMEAAKLNVFHWHLSDDQGFRVESRTHPLLQQKGSDGLFYTQQQVRDVIAYARDRGIRVVPEFDMPGHADSWFVGYPNLASGKGPYQIIRKWGIYDPAMDPTRESTYEFLDSFIGEMAALFPDAYFHIGGDECNGKEWDANPRIQQFMRAHGIKNDAALQAYFTTRVQPLVTKHGKVTVGWDEVLQPGTPKNVVIQSWRGQDSLAQAARAGNRGILSWGYYLDLNQPASQHYAVDPMGKSAAQLSPEEQSRILGGEAAEWTEYLNPEILTTRIWPRTAAIAERLWSAQSTTDVSSMYRRLGVFDRDLIFYGVQPDFTARGEFQRLVQGGDAGPLAVLGSVVEPTKEYERESLRDYDLYTPLDRMVDAVPAESTTAREFRDLCARIASGSGTPGDFAEARHQMHVWAANDAALAPHLTQSSLTEELVPVSLNLSESAQMGLSALDALEHHSAMPGGTRDADIARLKTMEKPAAVLLDQVIPSISLLVNATGR